MSNKRNYAVVHYIVISVLNYAKWLTNFSKSQHARPISLHHGPIDNLIGLFRVFLLLRYLSFLKVKRAFFIYFDTKCTNLIKSLSPIFLCPLKSTICHSPTIVNKVSGLINDSTFCPLTPGKTITETGYDFFLFSFLVLFRDRCQFFTLSLYSIVFEWSKKTHIA